MAEKRLIRVLFEFDDGTAKEVELPDPEALEFAAKRLDHSARELREYSKQSLHAVVDEDLLISSRALAIVAAFLRRTAGEVSDEG